MSTWHFSNQSKSVLKTLLLLFAFILYSCGGGSESSNGISGNTGSAGLYITDDISDYFKQVIITIHKVEFENTVDGTKIAAFEDSLGYTYDVAELNGILKKLPGATIPAGSYDRVLVTIGKELILVDSTGTQITPNPHFAGNTWTTCNGGTCVIEITGAINVADSQNVIIDFDLKQFTYDPVTNLVTAIITADDDGSEHKGYVESKEDDYELKGSIVNIDSDSFELTIMEAEHFSPHSNTVTVLVNDSTQYTCDDDDEISECNISSLNDLQTGMMVEIHGIWNGLEFEATRVELDNDNDLAGTNCTIPERSISNFSNLTLQPEIEGAVAYTFDSSDYSITVNETKILITKETLIKLESVSSEQVVCTDKIPENAKKIEVEYYHGKDHHGKDHSTNTANVARKIELDI